MSIFSKLFPGGAKGEGDTLPNANPSVDALEGGPMMKRPPNEGKSAEAVRPDPQGQKHASAPLPRGSGVRAQVAATPARPVAPTRATSPDPAAATHSARPPAGGTTSARPSGSPASARARSSPPPRASREEAAPKVSPTPSTNPGSPGSYVSVSASRLHGPASSSAPAAKAAPPPASSSHSGPGELRAPPVPPPRTPQSPKDSVKPPALEPERSNGGSIADTFERLLSSELDAGFASMQQPSHAPAPRTIVGADLEEVKGLFAQLAANHVRSVRDFVIDLRWSDATVEWVTICSPALRSLRRAAEKLELADLCRVLDKFSETLLVAQSDPGPTIGGERRAAILACYDELSRLMPQAFALDMDQTQRESVILQSLLLQVPDVKKVTLDKMYAAGLSTLEAMLLATAEDIAATTGVAELTAQRIVERFRAYRAHVKATAPDAARTRERQHIADLTSRLRREHDAFEQISQSWSRDADEQKKELRRVRAQTLLDIQVELARLGEVDRLSQIERLPFEGKLTELETFLEDARDKYVAQP
jgi:DNA repair protein RadA